MRLPVFPVLLALTLTRVDAHEYSRDALYRQQPMGMEIVDVENEPWTSKFGPQIDLGYSGPLSFSHLPYTRCLDDGAARFDIAILGMPFDTTTSYRPGTRQSTGRATLAWGTSPQEQGASLLDCWRRAPPIQVPISAYDNAKALDQMEAAYSTLLARPVHGGTTAAYKPSTAAFALDTSYTFDSHLDTWDPRPGAAQERITHGSFFSIAAEEGLLSNTSIHAGIRCHLSVEDLAHDGDVGFQLISTEDIDEYGLVEVVKQIRRRIGQNPVYLSLDIDVVVFPSLTCVAGTPEPGGWTTREVKRILRGLSGLNFVGADIVEVAPAYDHADITGIAAADIVYDFLAMMQLDSPPLPHVGPFSKSELR
ncbi:arginase family-domain-containing protein [Mycena filopes]|nr:arginase family-domain-containing protein [Mycena filopes]